MVRYRKIRLSPGLAPTKLHVNTMAWGEGRPMILKSPKESLACTRSDLTVQWVYVSDDWRRIAGWYLYDKTILFTHVINTWYSKTPKPS